MALIADDAAHRVEQLLLMTERLAALAAEDTRLIQERLPLSDGEEKNRLANAYRLELARIKQDDASVPVRHNGWWYYARYEAGREYPVYARKRATVGRR